MSLKCFFSSRRINTPANVYLFPAAEPGDLPVTPDNDIGDWVPLFVSSYLAIVSLSMSSF